MEAGWMAGDKSLRKLLGKRGCYTNWCIHLGHWSCEALKTVQDILCFVVYLGHRNQQQLILIAALLMPINTLITASLILLQWSPCTRPSLRLRRAEHPNSQQAYLAAWLWPKQSHTKLHQINTKNQTEGILLCTSSTKRKMRSSRSSTTYNSHHSMSLKP